MEVNLGKGARAGDISLANDNNFISNCMADNKQVAASTQEAQQTSDQSAAAKVTGINPLMIMVTIIIVIALFGGGTVYAGAKGIKIITAILPLVLLIVGVALTIWGIQKRARGHRLQTYIYAQSIIGDRSCDPKIARTTYKWSNVNELITAFDSDTDLRKYQGFQWEVIDNPLDAGYLKWKAKNASLAPTGNVICKTVFF